MTWGEFFIIPAFSQLLLLDCCWQCSFGAVRYRQASSVELLIYALLFMCSLITIVPPLFLAARYLAQPLAIFLFQHPR